LTRAPSPHHVPPPLVFRESFQRIPQHRSRHLRAVGVEKGPCGDGVALFRLAQHPADRFVNQVFAIVQQQIGEGERIADVTVPDEVLCRDDGNPPLPQ
jgi:hypothetical protein